jgi:hypothetical protein
LYDIGFVVRQRINELFPCHFQILCLSFIAFYITARKPQALKPGDEWHPERSGGKSSLWAETLGFSPGSGFINKDSLGV